MCRLAIQEDIAALAALFWDTVSANTSYISHAEIQTGIARDVGVLAGDGRDKWVNYAAEKVDDPHSAVFVSEREGSIEGFVIVAICEQGDPPFGVVSDLLVRPGSRGRGTGSRLLETGLQWLREHGAKAFYLESGVNNHPAHGFFERKGFRRVSHIFKL